MSQPNKCPQCGAEIPPDAPSGLCPKCLLQAGFESQPNIAATEQSPAAGGFVPPSLAEMSQKFPQLEILELLGKGGMGAVYKARQPGLDRLVAVKILPPEVGQDPAFAERFTREARALARLSHPNIVAVYDFGNASGLYYFIMDFVDGVNLREAIRSGGISPKETLAIIPQICDALQFAHDEGIVHRDIKPENVLIDKRGRVKIADFGLAKLMGQELMERNLTGTHQVMGTLRYMAPEQMAGSHAVDHRADIYSLGVVFYELLTGEVPMGRFAPPSKKVQIDVRLDEVVLRALEREPQQRYQHASELKTGVESITSAAGRIQSDVVEQRTVERVPDAKKRNKIPIRFLLGTTMSAALVWLVVPLLWNLRELGLAITCVAIGTFLIFVARQAVRFLPTAAERWRSLSPGRRRGSIGVHLVLACLGVYLLMVSGYQLWDLLNWSPVAPTSDQFQREYEGKEYRLLRELKQPAGEIPRADLVQSYGSVQIPWPWKLTTSSTPEHTGLNVFFLFITLLLGVLLTHSAFEPWLSERRWAISWPAEKLWAATMFPLLAMGFVGLVLPRDNTGKGQGIVVHDDFHTVATRLDSWAENSGFAVGDQSSWEIYRVPEGGLLARVELEHLWRPDVFDRWEMTLGGPRRAAPEISIQLMGDANENNTFASVFALTRAGDASNPANQAIQATVQSFYAALTGDKSATAPGVSASPRGAGQSLGSSASDVLPGTLLAVLAVALACAIIAFAGKRGGPATPDDSAGRAPPGWKTDLQPTSPEPWLSRCALAGAIWASYCFAVAFLAYPIVTWGGGLLESLLLVLAVVAALIAAVAPFGTTILGFVAIGQIRRSAGKLYGLPLAVFDALLFPLLLLDGLILVVVTAPTTLGLAMPTFGLRILYPALALGIGLPIIAWIDYRIVRAVWRNVTGFEAPPKPAPSAAAPSARRTGELVRRLALIYLVLVSLFDVALVALGSGNLVRSINEKQLNRTTAATAGDQGKAPSEIPDPDPTKEFDRQVRRAMSSHPYIFLNDDPATEWAGWPTWGFGIASLLCLAAWGYFVAKRPLTPRPRVWRYLLVAWACVALPLGIWFALWGLFPSQSPVVISGDAQRIVSLTLIGLIAPYVAMALVWLIFGPAPEPSPTAAPKEPRRPTYTRWVIMPMLVMFFLWLAGSVAAMAYYRMGAGEPSGPQQIMGLQVLGLILLGLALFVLLLLRWMQTLPSAAYWTLVKRLALSIACLVLAVAAVHVYSMSPWNTRYIESHRLVFAPQSKAYLRLELPCQFVSSSRSQAPYYAPDTFELRMEPFYANNLLHLMFVEWPGFKFRWAPENGEEPHEEPLDHQSPTGYINHHDHFVTWWQTDAHLDLDKPEIKQEVEELYRLLSGWDSEPPRQWDDFLSQAHKTLTHFDFVKEYPAQNLIALKATGFVLLYVLLGILVAFLAAIAASIFAARRQQKRSAQTLLPESLVPSP